jgi:hypothetical protein
MIRQAFVFLSVIFCHLAPGLAWAQEMALAFNAEISVRSDGVLDVTEQIKVRGEQNLLRIGLPRPFPGGGENGVRIELVSVMRDGTPERAVMDKDGATLMLQLGDDSQPLASGEHDYSLHYLIHDALRFEKDGDRLQWTVTPPDWKLPLRDASLRLHLPSGATLLSSDGRIDGGTTRPRDLILQPRDDLLLIDLMRPLRAGESLSLDIRWTKGFVTRPTRNELLQRQLRGQLHVVAAGLGVLGLALAFGLLRLLARAAGRNPLHEPLSPAMSRLVRHGVVDDQSLTATVVAMATKGYLTVEHMETGSFMLQRTWKEGDLGLIPTDRAIAESLYRDRPSRFIIGRENVEPLRMAQQSLRAALQREIEIMSLRAGRFCYAFVSLLLLAVFAVTIELAPTSQTAWFPAILMIGAALYAYHRLCLRPSALRWQIGRETRGALSTLADAFSTRSALPFALLSLAGLILLAMRLGLATAGLLGLALALALATLHKLRAPQRLGGRLTSAVTAQENQLRMPGLDATPANFEQQLPMAMALGLESNWASRFSDSFADGGSHAGYRPRWYSGLRQRFAPDVFAAALARALKEGIENAIG